MFSAEATQAVTQQNGLEDQLNSAEEDDQAGHAAIQVVLSGAVAKVVYKSAIQAIPHSLDFRYSFLKLLSQFKFEGMAAIQQAILDSIHTDFGDTEESWNLRARAGNESAEVPSSQVLVSVDTHICELLVCGVAAHGWQTGASVLSCLSSCLLWACSIRGVLSTNCAPMLFVAHVDLADFFLFIVCCLLYGRDSHTTVHWPLSTACANWYSWTPVHEVFML